MLEDPTLRNVTNPDFGAPPKEQNFYLQQLGAPHVSSFDYMVNIGLQDAINDMEPVEFALPNGSKVSFFLESAHLEAPRIPLGSIGSKNQCVYPKECRQRKITYKGRLNVSVGWSVDKKTQISFVKDLGDIPIMLRSSRCHLAKMTPTELVAHGEHEQEWGGYFLIKGLERLVRMLLMTRRNFPIAIRRSVWKMRGVLFSEYGISIRCVQEDQTAITNVLHFVTDGSSKFMFSYRKRIYYVPLVLILKCLSDYNDHYIYKKLIEGREDDLYYCDCMKTMLRAVHLEELHTQKECKAYLGKMFRIRFYDIPEWHSDEEVTDYILKRCVLIHLLDNRDKFNLLTFMNRKLFTLAHDQCKFEGADAVMMQEVLQGGHLYLQILKERLYNWLVAMRSCVLKRARSNVSFSLTHTELMNAAKQAGTLESNMENFMATGSLFSTSGLGLMQSTGLTIVPENINRMRYMSHFKAVHRGSFFQEMRTTEARQLLPDAWGFICPVHTPDGAPCGLLNHLTMNCIITDMPDKDLKKSIPTVLAELGMVTLEEVDKNEVRLKECYEVQVDGKPIGWIEDESVESVVFALRQIKVVGERIPATTEIVHVPRKKTKGQYPGLFIFTGPARMMRPLISLATGKIEYVGTFEQVYLEVAVKTEEIYPNVTTHLELSKTAFLSNLALLIPMPDCNQSPRNMYQCQMGKQTMGTPCHTWDLQAETKLYRLQTPSTPLFRPVHHDRIGLDDFAMGTNAIVAVISYTGYDMEDAMIINKMSEERGFAHGSIYKSEFVQIEEDLSYFCRDPTNSKLLDILDTDGLPYLGRQMQYGDILYSTYNGDKNRYETRKFEGKEDCFIHQVRMIGDFSSSSKSRIACITYRVPRNPSVGDKFASRAGQKGICSQKWATEDLPFTETGLVPDVVFNPHGFPSRMTIAMMIELMAGKSAALHGLVHDASPFRFSEENTAINHFGELLEAGGYNYYGTECMYSGIDGREMEAQIFFGVVHYQRLRHMVADKWQVRSTGPMNSLYRQPVQGRKRGGGVRFGEMERDSLISHGATFLLQDRLFHCSDKSEVSICTLCESILSPVSVVTRMGDKMSSSETKEICRLCNSAENVALMQVPYIFKFLVTQLASCNLNIKVQSQKA